MKVAVLAMAIVGASVGLSGAEAAGMPEGGKLDFIVFRKGEVIGENVLQFQDEGNRMRVDISTDVVVKFAFVPVYRFHHRSHEVWESGHLASLESQTDDDGKQHVLDIHAEGGHLAVLADGKPSDAASNIVPASLWNEQIVASNVILNTLTGRQMNVLVTDIGIEPVLVGGTVHPAHHYAINGDLQREVWFDAKGMLVQVQFKGDDGSEITYRLR